MNRLRNFENFRIILAGLKSEPELESKKRLISKALLYLSIASLFSFEVLKLAVIHTSIKAIRCQQFFVDALLYDVAFVHNQDQV